MLSGHSHIKHEATFLFKRLFFDSFFGWEKYKIKTILTSFVSLLSTSVVCQSLLLTRLQSWKVLKTKDKMNNLSAVYPFQVFSV